VNAAAPRTPEPATPSAAVPRPRIGPSERLSATLAFSLIVFGVVILGVGFSQDEAAPVVPTLDVILTQTSTPEPPKQADFIAQSNNQGGGNSDRAQRPREDQVAAGPGPAPAHADHRCAQPQSRGCARRPAQQRTAALAHRP